MRGSRRARIQAAPGTGATQNGYAVEKTTHGNFSVSFDAALAGGVTEVEAVAQVYTVALGGTFEVGDTFSITINGTEYKTTGLASGMGRTAFVSKHRVFSPVGSIWRYCMLDRADIWDPDNSATDNDAGFVNVASETEGNERLVVAARYQKLAAIFSQSDVRLCQLYSDPTNFAVSESRQ